MGLQIAVRAEYIEGQGRPETLKSPQIACITNETTTPIEALSMPGKTTERETLQAVINALAYTDAQSTLAYGYLGCESSKY